MPKKFPGEKFLGDIFPDWIKICYKVVSNKKSLYVFMAYMIYELTTYAIGLSHF